MKVTKKRYEHLATQHGKRFAKAWDYYCVATGAYLEAYKQAREDCIKQFQKSHDELVGTCSHPEAIEIIIKDLNHVGTEEVEETYEDGMTQLSCRTFEKWKEENESMSFKDAVKIYLPAYDFVDLRVNEDTNEVWFQGRAKKK